MPQPFRCQDYDRVIRTLVGVGPKALLARPALAVRVAVVGAIWTDVETRLGHLVGAILGIEAHTAMTMYLAFTSRQGRVDGLRAIASKRLARELYDELVALTAEVRKRSKERDKLAHADWYAFDAFPDALVRGDPDEGLDSQGRFETMLAAAEAGRDERRLMLELAAGPSPWLIYREVDFNEIDKRLNDLHDRLRAFSTKIAPHKGDLAARLARIKSRWQ